AWSTHVEVGVHERLRLPTSLLPRSGTIMALRDDHVSKRARGPGRCRLSGVKNRSADVGAPDLTDESTVRASIVVAVPIDRAFEVFSSEMTSWWPRTHHIGTAPMAAAIIEPRVGGRWYELGDDGSECLWGIVLDWEPPRHLALSWHLDGDFRYDSDAVRSSRVDVSFHALADGSTRVELEHSGLEAHGPTWKRLRGSISSGWPKVLDSFSHRIASD